ncbi:MAG: hypothetical protein PHO07_15525 [Pirellulales bacterium]|jgi:hypothetical protein|nr:hypothetical protein [Pirellulales bacterium]MDI9446986.1 hypothetical protein [Planctomycetota bacterium]
MIRTRRAFLRTGAATLAGSCLAARGTAAVSERGETEIKCLDYARSFICGTAAFNNVRFWVESRTTIFDDNAGTVTDYYQCASCKSENTFGEKDLFLADNYDFLPILGGGFWLVFRRPARISDRYRTIRKAEEMWGEPRLLLRDATEITRLETFEAIRDATAAGLPLVTQTEIRNEPMGLRAVIECPSKTMNISLDKNMYQVDTGPVAYPDLDKTFDPQIACLSVAFVAFNTPHFADFIVEQPTSLVVDGTEKGEFYHFSAPFSLPAKNTLLAMGRLPSA